MIRLRDLHPGTRFRLKLDGKRYQFLGTMTERHIVSNRARGAT